MDALKTIFLTPIMSDRDPRAFHRVGKFSASLENTVLAS